MWILFEIDDNKWVEKDEVIEYLRQMAYPKMEIPQEQVTDIFAMFDPDQQGHLD